MTHILKSISQRFLGSQHFPAGINQFTFTIEKISNETIEDYKSIKKERKKVRIVYFKNSPDWALPWICNQTNANLIYNSCNIKDIEDYENVQLTLFIAHNVAKPTDVVSYDNNDNEIKEKKIIMGEALRVRKAFLPKEEKERRNQQEKTAQSFLVDTINEYISICKPEYSINEFESAIGCKVGNLSARRCSEFSSRLLKSINAKKDEGK